MADKCEVCGGIHDSLKFKVGDRVKVLSMMPHRMEKMWFHKDGEPRDYAGEIGVIVRAALWERIGASSYLINFNPDPKGPWNSEPFQECQLELAQLTY